MSSFVFFLFVFFLYFHSLSFFCLFSANLTYFWLSNTSFQLATFWSFVCNANGCTMLICQLKKFPTCCGRLNPLTPSHFFKYGHCVCSYAEEYCVIGHRINEYLWAASHVKCSRSLRRFCSRLLCLVSDNFISSAGCFRWSISRSLKTVA